MYMYDNVHICICTDMCMCIYVCLYTHTYIYRNTRPPFPSLRMFQSTVLCWHYGVHILRYIMLLLLAEYLHILHFIMLHVQALAKTTR